MTTVTPWGVNASINDARVIDKPWGSELLFAAVEGLYVGKIITVAPGHALSCQVHHHKTETQHVLVGVALVHYGPSPDALTEIRLYPGQSIHIPAGVVHRITAANDEVLEFAEVSTAHHGWETDITRFADAYGREGTTAQ